MTPSSDAARVPLAICLLAMSLLAFQLIATRIFSVILWNHFAFLAISVALFGFGVAGVAVTLLPKFFTHQRAKRQIRACCLALPFAFIASVSILCALPIKINFSTEMFAYLGIVFVTSSIPFVVGGIGVTLALSRWPRNVNRIYAFDLVGSSLGCLVVIALLQWLDGPTAAFAIGLLPLAAALWLQRSNLAIALVALVLVATTVNASESLVRVWIARSSIQNPVFEQWNAFSRVTVGAVGAFRGWGVGPMSTEPSVPAMRIFIDADAMTPMFRFDGDLAKVRIVLADVTSLAYHVFPNAPKVLVIGAGGGKDVLAALASGAKHVRAVELNPLIAREVVSEQFRDFSGDLYRHPRVELVVGEGRSTLRRDPGTYDILQLSMVDTAAASAAGALALTENSLYTVDAAREFLRHLEPGGILTATWANMRRLHGANRLVGQLAEALRLEGYQDVSGRMAALGIRGLGGRATLVNVLVRPSGFSEADVARLRGVAKARGLVPLYLPGDPLENYRPSNVHAVPIRIQIRGVDLDTFYAEYPLDLRPVTDDRPFFFYQNRLRDAIPALVPVGADSFYGNGLVILVRLIVISSVAVLLCIAVPMAFGNRAGLLALAGRGRLLLYFLCLGLGFITFEIAFLQMFAYYLGHPLLGLGVCLASLLLFTGIGSGLAGRWKDADVGPRLSLAIAAVIGVGLLAYVSLPLIMNFSLGWPVASRSAVAAVVIAPVGLVLGMPFPSGVRLLGDRADVIAWMWAINAMATVLGTSLATLAVMHLGFRAAILIAVAIYAVAWLAVREHRRTT